MNQGAPPNFAAYQLPFSQPLGLFSGLKDLLQGNRRPDLSRSWLQIVKELNPQKKEVFTNPFLSNWWVFGAHLFVPIESMRLI